MAKEYIIRDVALAFPFANGQYDRENADTHFINGCESYREWLEAIPAADVVEVRHGRWINGRCSECGEHAPFWSMASTYHLSKYCHGCGAKMDGGQGDGN